MPYPHAHLLSGDDAPCPGTIRPMGGPGREWTYRKGGSVLCGEIPADIILPTCDVCGECLVTGADCARIDRALGADE